MNPLEAHPELNVKLRRRNFRSAGGAVEAAYGVSEFPSGAVPICPCQISLDCIIRGVTWSLHQIHVSVV